MRKDLLEDKVRHLQHEVKQLEDRIEYYSQTNDMLSKERKMYIEKSNYFSDQASNLRLLMTRMVENLSKVNQDHLARLTFDLLVLPDKTDEPNYQHSIFHPSPCRVIPLT